MESAGVRSPPGTPESAGHGSGDTVVVSIGPAGASQRSDAGLDQIMEARTPSRSRAPSDDEDGGTKVDRSERRSIWVVNEIKDTISPFVMEESPSVLSIGKRCADNGYGFLWMPGEEPVMFDDQKTVIRLRVKDHIPYLVPNDEAEHEPLGKFTISALGAIDYPGDVTGEQPGDRLSAPGDAPPAAPAGEREEEDEDDGDERDEGGGSDEDEVEVDVEAGRGVKRKKGDAQTRS